MTSTSTQASSAGSGSIGRRLALALVGVSVFTLLAVGIAFYGFSGRYVVSQQKTEMLDRAVVVAEQIDELWEDGATWSLAEQAMLARILRLNERTLPLGAGLALLVDGEVAAQRGSVPSGLTSVAGRIQSVAVQGGGVESYEVRGTDDSRGLQLILAVAPVSDDSETVAAVVVTLPVSDASAGRGGLARIILFSGAVAIGLAVAVGLGLGAWLARPLKRLSHAAGAMASGSYEDPITGSYPGEVQDLADSLETMRKEVKHSEDSLRGFVASAAHELRTPLTSIEGFSQALLDGTAATAEQQQRSAAAIYRESTRLRRLVDALLTLSRYDSREYRPILVGFDAGALVREEADRLVEARLAEPGRVTVIAGRETRATTDPDMVRQIVANLLRNAVQYGGDDPIEATVEAVSHPPAGPLDGVDETLSAAIPVADGGSSSGWLVISVANGGQPLSAEDRDHLFERFYRGRSEHRTEGFGLGLALVKEICEVLGGRVELVGPGPRTVFRVVIPQGGPAARTGSATRE